MLLKRVDPLVPLYRSIYSAAGSVSSLGGSIHTARWIDVSSVGLMQPRPDLNLGLPQPRLKLVRMACRDHSQILGQLKQYPDLNLGLDAAKPRYKYIDAALRNLIYPFTTYSAAATAFVEPDLSAASAPPPSPTGSPRNGAKAELPRCPCWGD